MGKTTKEEAPTNPTSKIKHISNLRARPMTKALMSWGRIIDIKFQPAHKVNLKSSWFNSWIDSDKMKD